MSDSRTIVQISLTAHQDDFSAVLRRCRAGVALVSVRHLCRAGVRMSRILRQRRVDVRPSLVSRRCRAVTGIALVSRRCRVVTRIALVSRRCRAVTRIALVSRRCRAVTCIAPVSRLPGSSVAVASPETSGSEQSFSVCRAPQKSSPRSRYRHAFVFAPRLIVAILLSEGMFQVWSRSASSTANERPIGFSCGNSRNLNTSRCEKFR